MEEVELKTYLNELKKYTPYDFSDYSDNSIHRRLRKILQDYDLSLEQLLERTKNDQAFVERIVEEITVNTTEFFRDPELWVSFYNRAYQAIKSKKIINIWHSGCSMGNEVYSNLIILSELGLLDKVRVFGTDINAQMVKMAKKGRMPYQFNKAQFEAFNSVLSKSPLVGISKIDFSKYFDIDSDHDEVVFKDFLRRVPQFSKHDLVKDENPFFHKFDIIFCRNVLIYFNTGLQSKVFQKFYDQMYPGGFLMLGNHEMVSGFFKTKFVKNGPAYVKSGTFNFTY